MCILDKKGFTLIELVVVFSVMAVLATVGMASFLNFSRSQALQQAASDVTATLNTAKSEAVAQVKPTAAGSKCLQGALNGYRIVITKAGAYTLYALCNGATDNASKVAKQLNGVNFDATSFAVPALPITITFLVVTGGVIVDNGVMDAQGNADIIIDGTGSVLNKIIKKIISVSPGGIIQ